MKRAFDFSLSLVLIVLLGPVYVIIAALIYLKLGRPIFYDQVRPGYKGELFKIYKFRTMSNETDANGELLPDLERLTPPFEFIRRLSLDEIPQFFNILRGQMSFVGPRPLLESYLPYYSKEQMKRHDVLPGLTGWAQIHGRNDTTWSERLGRDQWYAENQSFRLDLYIIWKTIRIVLKSEGNSTQAQTEMGEFRGLDGGNTHEIAKH
ncbi:sugar transferase [Exiguobacterium flavidum]|uniref:sugar transferase n=1 Tax=Exiguobacterium flavidum TaxID=2184695 RepID=UPI000DF809BE|nr:sugar transferase [Exiguobacterium flavidum]